MTKQKNQPRWTAKGNFGYFRSEKKRRTLVTAALFAGPLIVLISAWIYYKTRLNVWTVLAVVSSLPGCRSLVNLIMLLRCRSMDPELYQEIHDHQGNLTMAYEMYMTFYEKSAYVDAFAVCGNSVVLFSSDTKTDAAYIAENAQKILRGNGYKADVKLLKEKKAFLERLDSMNRHQDSLREGILFTPDEKYPDLSREELIRHTLLALCL